MKFSVIALTRLAATHLTKTKGNIVNVSSIGAQRVALHSVPYVLTKASLDLYTRNAAVQYADQGVRVNTVRFVCLYLVFAILESLDFRIK
jgi:NAD(P)-dependent dehydrogenase (short-subunit alcohol dehydrogenase family)